MKSILFIDPCAPKPYTIDSLASGRMGGTEATVIRVMRELAERYEVNIEQRGRETTESYDQRKNLVMFYPPDLFKATPDIVITLRDARVFQDTKKRFPNSRHYLWMHDVSSGEYRNHLELELNNDYSDIIFVSQWHKAQVLNSIPEITIAGRITPHVIFNPIEYYCVKKAYPVDPYQLIYFSSPHKGLDQVLKAFEMLRMHDSKYRLLVANPGYYEDKGDLPEGVRHIHKPHYELMQDVAESLCMFYPQTVFEETFGIVYAESNAVGTPVLCHDLGAAREVLDNQSQIVNCNNIGKIIDTVSKWTAGERPTVGRNPLITLSEVTKSWIKLIEFGSSA